MTNGDSHSLDAARVAAARNELGAWVAEFFASPGSDNAALGEELTNGLRWWLGPVQGFALERPLVTPGCAGVAIVVLVEGCRELDRARTVGMLLWDVP
jgi:hypothetical protein